MNYSNTQRRPARRVNAHGQLVLAEPYRWRPGISDLPTERLRKLTLDWGSYDHAAQLDELDRRAPKTASLCFDVKKGWQPLVG